jgi:DNA-binding response OmpR family regulator
MTEQMRKTSVLFVDDDVTLGKTVALALEESGYDVHYQTSLAAIQSVVAEISPDVIVLDVEIGEKNSIGIVPELRIMNPHIPILFVSSHTGGEEAAKALDAGGMAYLKKPFEIAELIAYINRLSTTPSYQDTICFSSLAFNPKENLLLKGNAVIHHLTALECKLLELLIAHKNQPVRREFIEKELWGKTNGHEHSLNNHISRLRKALSADPDVSLETIPKKGYRLVEKAPV